MSVVPAAAPASDVNATATAPALPPGAGDLCPPIADAEIAAAALAMNMAGGGGSGAQLLASLLDETIELPELAQRINAQPGIAVRVMRVANSAYYGRSGQVATVMRASQVVGATALRGIAAAACFDRMSAPGAASLPLDMTAFRQHSLATACAAQALALVAVPDSADQVFMAGLLHDIGILVQWRLRPQWLAQLRAGAGAEADVAAAASPTATTAETAYRAAAAREIRGVGATHAHCGRVLLEAWRLPSALVDAVDRHDGAGATPAGAADADAARFAGLLQLADAVATSTGHGFDADRAPLPIESIDVAPLHLTPQQVDAVAAGLAEAVARLDAAFGD